MADVKRVYTFGNKEAEGNGKMRELLGGKGANLAEMNLIGIPVPPGFTITTEVCAEYYRHGKQAIIELLRTPAETLFHNIHSHKFISSEDKRIIPSGHNHRLGSLGNLNVMDLSGLCHSDYIIVDGNERNIILNPAKMRKHFTTVNVHRQM